MQKDPILSSREGKIEILPSPIKKPLNLAVCTVLTAFSNPEEILDRSIFKSAVTKNGLLISKILRKNEILFVEKPIGSEGIINWWPHEMQEFWSNRDLTRKTPFAWSVIILKSFLGEMENEDLLLKPRQFLLDIGIDSEKIEDLRDSVGHLFRCFVERGSEYSVEDMILNENTIQALEAIGQNTEYFDLPLVG